MILLVINVVVLFLCTTLVLSVMYINSHNKTRSEKDPKENMSNIKYGLTHEWLMNLRSQNTDIDEVKFVRNAANKLLDRTGVKNFPVPVENLIRAMGFYLFSSNIKKANISAIIAIDDRFILDFDNDKIVISNKNDTIEHQRFAIAHEIAHYIFDYNEGESFYDNYNTDEENDAVEETRANLFAAELMMPYSSFTNYVNNLKKSDLSNSDILEKVSEYFGAPKRAVARRYVEVNRNDLLIDTAYEDMASWNLMIQYII